MSSCGYIIQLIIFLLLINCSTAKTICISCGGTNELGCGSTNCCNSLQYVLSSVAEPNDIITFEAGSYISLDNLNQDITMTNLTITSSSGPEETIIHLEYFPKAYFVSVSNVDNFVLSNLTLTGRTTTKTNSVEAGTVSFKYVNNVIVSNCKFTNSSVFRYSAIYHLSNAYVSLKVENCTFSDMYMNLVGSDSNTHIYGLGVFSNAPGELIVRDCKFLNLSVHADSGMANGCALVLEYTIEGGIYDNIFYNLYVYDSYYSGIGGLAIWTYGLPNQMEVIGCQFINISLENMDTSNNYAGIIINGNNLNFTNCYFETSDNELLGPIFTMVPLIVGSDIIFQDSVFANMNLIAANIISTRVGESIIVNNCAFRNITFSSSKLYYLIGSIGGTLTLNDNTFEDIYLLYEEGTIIQTPKSIINNCVFRNCESQSNLVLIQSGIISNSSFQNNTIQSSIITIKEGSPMVVTNNIFESNVDGNIIVIDRVQRCSPITINNCTFNFNIAENDLGPAIYIMNGNITIENSNFNGNVGLFGYNGAIGVGDGHFGICDFDQQENKVLISSHNNNSTASITNCTFNENYPIPSGGVINCIGYSDCNDKNISIKAGDPLQISVTPLDYCYDEINDYINSVDQFDIYSLPNNNLKTYEICNSSTPNDNLYAELICPPHNVIKEVIYFYYGVLTPIGDCEWNNTCPYVDGTALIEELCLNKTECQVTQNDVQTNVPDPCMYIVKSFAIVVRCANFTHNEFSNWTTIQTNDAIIMNQNISFQQEQIAKFELFFKGKPIPVDNTTGSVIVFPNELFVPNTICNGSAFDIGGSMGPFGVNGEFSIYCFDEYMNLVWPTEAQIIPTITVINLNNSNIEVTTSTSYNKTSKYFTASYIILFPNNGYYEISVYFGDQLAEQSIVYYWIIDNLWVDGISTIQCTNFSNYDTPCNISTAPHFLNSIQRATTTQINLFGSNPYIYSNTIEFSTPVILQPDISSISDEDSILFDCNNELENPFFIFNSLVQFESVQFINCKTTAIKIMNCNATLTNLSFLNNNIENGYVIDINHSNVLLNNCLYTENILSNENTQIGILNGNQSTIVASNLNFENNFSDNENSCIYLSDSSFTMNESLFQNNTKVLNNMNSNCIINNSIFDKNNKSIDNFNGNLFINNSNFTNHYIEANHVLGTAIYSSMNDFTNIIEIKNCEFNNNAIKSKNNSAHGGAIVFSFYLSNITSNSGNFSFINCKFNNNSAFGSNANEYITYPSSAYGGAISILSNIQNNTNLFQHVYFDVCEFNNNKAIGGSGFYEQSNRGIVSIHPEGAQGGAIYCNNTILTISNSKFNENQISPGNIYSKEKYYNSTIQFSPTIYDNEIENTIVNGASISLHVPDNNNISKLENITFDKNYLSSVKNVNFLSYGSILSIKASLSLNNLNFINNEIQGENGKISGGIVYIDCFSNNNISNITFINNTIISNIILGGIFFDSYSFNKTSNLNLFSVENNLIKCTSVEGGIIMSNGNLNLNNCFINENNIYSISNFIGLIYNKNSIQTNIQNSNILNNYIESIENANGGGIAISTPESQNTNINLFNIQIKNNTIELNNSTSSYGGGLFIKSKNNNENFNVQFNLTNLNIELNKANYGGGISTDIIESILFNNVTILSNQGQISGGGLYFNSKLNSEKIKALCSNSDNYVYLFNNKASIGSSCAAQISKLNSVFNPPTIVYPNELFSLRFALMDIFENIYYLDTQLIANSNLDPYFSSGIEQVSEPSLKTNIYLFSRSYFSTNDTLQSSNHAIDFKTYDNQYETKLNFIVSTCPPNYFKTLTTCYPCQIGYSLQSGNSICSNCPSSDPFCVSNDITNSSISIETIENLYNSSFSLINNYENTNYTTLMKILSGYWPVPSSNNFINPTDLILCSNCREYLCKNQFSFENNNWYVDCSISHYNNDIIQLLNNSDSNCNINPNNYYCCEGYTGRLCSKCENSYFISREKCILCSDDDWQLIILPFDLIIALVLIILAIKFRKHLLALCFEVTLTILLFIFGFENFWATFILLLVFSTLFLFNSKLRDGVLKCLIYFVQTCGLFLSSLFSWNSVQIPQLFTRNSIECYFPDATIYINFWISMLMPIFIILLCYLLYMIGLLTKFKKSSNLPPRNDISLPLIVNDDPNEYDDDDDDNEKDRIRDIEIEPVDPKLLWKYRCFKITLFLLYIIYNEVITEVFSNFSCSREPGGEFYLMFAPWKTCSFDDFGYFWGLLIPSIIFLVIYVFGFPFGIWFIMFRNRNSLDSPRMLKSMGFVYDNFKPSFWWIEIAFLIRRILLAICAVLPINIKEEGAMIVITIFLIFFSVTSPYQNRAEINSEILANSALLLLIGTGSYYYWVGNIAYSIFGIILYFFVVIGLFIGLFKKPGTACLCVKS